MSQRIACPICGKLCRVSKKGWLYSHLSSGVHCHGSDVIKEAVITVESANEEVKEQIDTLKKLKNSFGFWFE
jgi:hypothetical protein